MTLKEILKSPRSSQEYCERYVNSGSPSGFTTIASTSTKTQPATGNCFRLLAGQFTSPIKEYGDVSQIPNVLQQYATLLHPDMLEKYAILGCTDVDVLVAPTASARTVQLVSDPAVHLKLHYDGVLGRLDRSLGMREANYGTWISERVHKLIENQICSPWLHFMPEPYARVLSFETSEKMQEVGIVVRHAIACGPRSADVHALVPAFALFSPDSKRPYDAPIVFQLAAIAGMTKSDFIIEKLVVPLVDSYFSLLLTGGIQAEMHAQNVLFGLSDHGEVLAVVIRDMESCDTDTSLCDLLGISYDSLPSKHKALYVEMDNYVIKHSFMFDFKLCDYLIDKLVTIFTDANIISSATIYGAWKDRVRWWISRLPNGFFPEDCWYSVEKVQIDRSTSQRPYIGNRILKWR